MWLNQRHENRDEILRCVVYTSSDSGDQRGWMRNSDYQWCSCRFQNEIIAEEEILQPVSPKQREFTDSFGQNLSLGKDDPQEEGIFLFLKNTGVFSSLLLAEQPPPVFLPGKSSWTEELSRLQSTGLQRVRHDWTDLVYSHNLSCVALWATGYYMTKRQKPTCISLSLCLCSWMNKTWGCYEMWVISHYVDPAGIIEHSWIWICKML